MPMPFSTHHEADVSHNSLRDATEDQIILNDKRDCDYVNHDKPEAAAPKERSQYKTLHTEASRRAAQKAGPAQQEAMQANSLE